MSIPDYQSLMLPVLVALSKGEVRTGPAVDELVEKFAPVATQKQTGSIMSRSHPIGVTD
jgi:hypothetical protein